MDPSYVYEDKTIAILLLAFSVVLLANGIFAIEQFSVQYGVGAGALLESSAYNISVIPVLSTITSQIQSTYQMMLESVFMTGIGFIMSLMAFSLLTHKNSRYGSYIRRHVPVHIMLAIVYLSMLVIMRATAVVRISSFDSYLTYASIFFSILLDMYLEYSLRKYESSRKLSGNISINPLTPFGNIVQLRNTLFEKLQGEIGIVDKHFNSVALHNLYRLIPTGSSRIKSIKVLTSESMLDSRFGQNYYDLKEEFKNLGINLEVKVMAEADATAQHERFILDDNGSYKIPPFNIINKKSEHITRINTKDSRSRFEYLYQNSVKFENLSSRSKS